MCVFRLSKKKLLEQHYSWAPCAIASSISTSGRVLDMLTFGLIDNSMDQLCDSFKQFEAHIAGSVINKQFSVGKMQ